MLIERITPVDSSYGRLVIEFAYMEYRLFSARMGKLRETHPFLIYPDKLKSFVYNQSSITWFNKVSFDADFLYRHSHPVDITDLYREYLKLGAKNQAPTSEHQTHHFYDIMISPFDLDNSFILSESIGGGHGEMGGSKYYSLKALLAYADWRLHFEKADCAWAIPIIEENKDDIQALLNILVDEIIKKTEPLN